LYRCARIQGIGGLDDKGFARLTLYQQHFLVSFIRGGWTPPFFWNKNGRILTSNSSHMNCYSW
jgi:hypothetical protein